MKIKLLLLVLCGALASLPAHGQRVTTLVEQEAQKYAKALMVNDYPRVLGYTHERIVTMMGGKEAALGRLKKSMEEMKSKGLGLEDTKIGTAQGPQKIGTWIVSIVPEILTLRMPENKAKQESYLLGISADEGKTWKFVDLGPISEAQLFSVFPELKGQFKMPAKTQAVMEKSP